LEAIQNKIYMIRGQKVMLDNDLAALYQVSTKRLNEQVKRNLKRFPDDFMIRLTEEENKSLRSQIATSRWGGRRNSPLAFTEQGVAKLSTVLNSERAIQVNIAIMRAFVKLRQILSANKDLTAKLDELERRVGSHDVKIQAIFEAIKRLTMPVDVKKKEKIGFI
jgi:hypothetical protein